MFKLAICTMVRNEESIIKEWMAFHLASGADRLIIFDDQSTDKTKQIILDFAARTGAVDYISDQERHSQVSVYEKLMERCKGQFEWAAFIDADEFLFNPHGVDLRTALSPYENFGGVGVYWLIYGSSGITEKPEGLCIENYTCRSNQSYPLNHHIKTIVKLEHAVRPVTAHFFVTERPIVDENFVEFEPVPPYGLFPSHTPAHNILRINHYHTRSYSDYLDKAKRGYSYGGESDDKLQSSEHFQQMFSAHDKNDEVDKSALVFYDKVLGFMKNNV